MNFLLIGIGDDGQIIDTWISPRWFDTIRSYNRGSWSITSLGTLII